MTQYENCILSAKGYERDLRKAGYDGLATAIGCMRRQCDRIAAEEKETGEKDDILLDSIKLAEAVFLSARLLQRYSLCDR